VPRKNVVRVRPTSDGDVARSAVTRGKAGVYMSVANGGTALCSASVSTNEVDTAAPAPALRPAAVTGGDESPLAAIDTPPPSRPAPISHHRTHPADRSGRRRDAGVSRAPG